MSKVLVTGADGFTGRHLAPLLASLGHEVHGLCQSPPVDQLEGVTEVHFANLTNKDQVETSIRLAAPHYVVHLAGIAFVANRDAKLMYDVNLLGTRHLLEALSALSSPPRAVLLASSANVYGNVSDGALNELTVVAPSNDYAVSKLAMEYLAKLYTSRLPIIVCRPFNYTGVGQSDSFLLAKIVSHIRKKASHIELGNLDVARDFSDVRDVSSVYAQLVVSQAAVGITVNVCSGVAHTLRNILEMAEMISGRRLEVKVNADLVRPNEVKVLRGDRTKLNALLPNSKRWIELSETLRWMIEAPASN